MARRFALSQLGKGSDLISIPASSCAAHLSAYRSFSVASAAPRSKAEDEDQHRRRAFSPNSSTLLALYNFANLTETR